MIKLFNKIINKISKTIVQVKNLPEEFLLNKTIQKEVRNKDINLYISHNQGGGSEINIDEQNLLTPSIIIKPAENDLFELTFFYKSILEGKISSLDLFSNTLNSAKSTNVIINSLFGYKNIFRMKSFIKNIKNKSYTKIMIHDYFSICPSAFLLNREENFCNLPNELTCCDCYEKNPLISRITKKRFSNIKKWRKLWNEFFEEISDEIRVFSNSSKEILLKIYPKIEPKINLCPHIMTYAKIPEQSKHENNKLKIAFLGNVNCTHKGKKIIDEMIEENLSSEIFDFTVIGEYEGKIEIETTGKYYKTELFEYIEKINPNIIFIPSICPETFSFTTAEAILSNRFVACFDMGAQAEKVKAYSKGLVISNIDAKSALFEIEKYLTKNH